MSMPLREYEIKQDSGFPYYVLYEQISDGTDHTVWLNGLKQQGSFSIENRGMLSQMLIDHLGNYWFGEEREKSKETTNLYVFNNDGVFLKNLTVYGHPNLFELGENVYAGCEGADGRARIYRFAKDTQHLVREWTVDGFFWDLEQHDDRLYISCYLPEKDEAVLYVIDGDELTDVSLGEHCFPTDVLFLGESLFVSVCPVLRNGEKKVIQLNRQLNVVNEFALNTSPRHLYAFGCELVVHGLELASDEQERLIYFNFSTGQRKEYVIPHAHTIKGNKDRLFLVNLETESVIQWDHKQRKITSVSRLPKGEHHNMVDIHCCSQ